jgi:NADPH2:quinone reductase
MSSVTTTMRVMAVPRPGGPEALTLEHRLVPAPREDEVLIRVAAAGLNRADVLQRKGAYPPPRDAPDYPGLEVAGTVVAVGVGVTGFTNGQPVCALLQGGGYADYAVAPAGQTLPVPAGLSLVEAASLPEAYFTVWSNVYGFGRLAPGESLLVHGGSSGIGVAAIQLAAVRGQVVYATAGTDDKCRYCESLGARAAINYRQQDFVAALREASAGRGVDVVLDMVGGDYLPRNLEVLAPQGRIVIIATQGGSTATIDLRQVMLKRAVITGSTLRPQPVAFKKAIKAELLQHVWPLLAAGTLKPIVDRVLPLTAAAEAHAYMETSAHRGKIVLTT